MKLPLAPFRGVLFEDHFGYGHIQFEKNETLWSRRFPNYARAASVARGLGLITLMQLDAIYHQVPNYPRSILLFVGGDRDVKALITEEFKPLRPS